MQDRRGAVGGRLRLGAEQATARNFVLWGQGLPGREVFLSRPAGHVGSNLGEEAQGAVGANGIDLGEIDIGQVVERGANLEARLIVARFLARAARGHGGRPALASRRLA